VTTFACGQCGAGLAFAGVRTETCPYCASPNVVERPPAAGQPDPAFVVTFVGDAAAARRALDRWLGSRTLFADSALRAARVEDLRGVYVPAYLYSAVAHSEFHAQIGAHSTETRTVTTKDAEGKPRTETRTVTRTEYRPLAGKHVSYVTDVVVSASAGLAHAELEAVEPFDLRQMRRYGPALVSGWIAEEFSRAAGDCEQASRQQARDQLGDTLRRFMPGDSSSDLAWQTQVHWEVLDPILVPVWVLAVRYRGDRPALRVVINGQTGRIAGKVPLSPWKIAVGLLVLAALIVGIVLAVRGGAP